MSYQSAPYHYACWRQFRPDNGHIDRESLKWMLWCLIREPFSQWCQCTISRSGCPHENLCSGYSQLLVPVWIIYRKIDCILAFSSVCHWCTWDDRFSYGWLWILQPQDECWYNLLSTVSQTGRYCFLWLLWFSPSAVCLRALFQMVFGSSICSRLHAILPGIHRSSVYPSLCAHLSADRCILYWLSLLRFVWLLGALQPPPLELVHFF